jgi:hypothetical protein
MIMSKDGAYAVSINWSAESKEDLVTAESKVRPVSTI